MGRGLEVGRGLNGWGLEREGRGLGGAGRGGAWDSTPTGPRLRKPAQARP